MNIEECLEASVKSPKTQAAAIEHQKSLVSFPEFEPDFAKKGLEVTVRFSIVSAVRPDLA